MAKFLFKSICPICFEDDVMEWTHSDCGGRRYIDENLYLICEKCSDRTFILDAYFTCNNHNKSEKPDKYGMIEIITCIRNFPDMNCQTRRKMRSKLCSFRC